MTEMEPRTFLIASGILMAILLVWAQLWAATAERYEKHGASSGSAGYGLAFTYWAILGALGAFGLTLARGSISKLALTLLGFSLALTAFLVAVSFIFAVAKVLTNKPLWEPLLNWNLPFMGRLAFAVLVPLLLFLLVWIFIYHRGLGLTILMGLLTWDG